MGRLPDFVIIGAMKCGTSTLHEQLALRSGIFMSNPKEPNFFSDDAALGRGTEEYSALFASARPDQICGESSTHYTKLPTYPNTVAALRRYVPEARLVYVVRDPLARIASQYIHEWTSLEVSGSFEDAVLHNPRFVAYSRYAYQLRPFLEGFGPDRVLLVSFERMVRCPEEQLERVSRFLGDPSQEPLRWDPSRGEQNVSKDRLRKSALRERLLEIDVIQNLKNLLPQKARDVIKSYWQLKKRPALSSSTKQKVEAELDRDLAELGRWVGLPLSCANWSSLADVAAPDWKEPPTRAAAREHAG